MLNLGVIFPNFDVTTTLGKLKLHDFFGDSWALICSHPADFTPVCTTEIARMAQLVKETDKRNVKVCFLSCDPVEMHLEWIKDIEKFSGCKIPFPVIDDANNTISAQVGMNDEGLDKFQTVRGVFILDPSKKIRATLCYPTEVGRNFDEIIRVVDALQLTAQNREIVCPAGWKVGDEVLVKPGCEGTGARVEQLPSGKEYLRFQKC